MLTAKTLTFMNKKSSKLTQFNVRIPKPLARAMRVSAAMLETDLQQLSQDAVAIYYGAASEEVRERQARAVESAKKALTAEEWCALQGSNLRPLPCEGSDKGRREATHVIRVKVRKIAPIESAHVPPSMPDATVVHFPQKGRFRDRGTLAAAA